MNGPVHLLLLSGSLREPSTSSALLRAFAALVPSTFTVSLYDRLTELPPFETGLSELPPEVEDLRDQVASADALVISATEDQGLTGAFKNTLNWMITSVAMVDKRVALLSSQSGSGGAEESLNEALRAMSARIIPEASPHLALPGNPLDERAIIAQAHLRKAIFQSIDAISDACRT